MKISPLDIFTKAAQVVIELKTAKQLVMAFLVGMEDSWEMVREEVQRRLHVLRASFFSEGRELTGNVEGLVVEDHVLTFNLLFRDPLLRALKTEDLESSSVELLSIGRSCVVSGDGTDGTGSALTKVPDPDHWQEPEGKQNDGHGLSGNDGRANDASYAAYDDATSISRPSLAATCDSTCDATHDATCDAYATSNGSDYARRNANPSRCSGPLAASPG
eukprot:symbB.v1.2.007163.t1/scaffold437.1/size205459/2